MLDCQLYGLNAGNHLTNLLLHVRHRDSLVPGFMANDRQLLGPVRSWRPCWPCIRSAWSRSHGLRNARDVLSGLLFMSTLAAYVGYVRHRFSLCRYSMVMFLFALGLMAKPMLVTLPFVLLLLDYWPLGRMTKSPASRLRLRKTSRQAVSRSHVPSGREAPAVALAAISCVLTFGPSVKPS